MVRLIQSPQFWAYLWRDLWYYSLPDLYKIYKNPLVWIKVDLAGKPFEKVEHREFAKLLKERSERVESLSVDVSTISAEEYVGFVEDWPEDLSMLKNQAITLSEDEGFVAVPRYHSYRTQFMMSNLVNTQCIPVRSNYKSI